MRGNGFVDGCLEILRREEALLSRFVEVLQDDQRAIAAARAELLEENIRRKEVLLDEMKVLDEARRGLFAAAGLPAGGGYRAGEILSLVPDGARGDVRDAIGRIRSLREALAELNDFTRKVMIHGLVLVRSTLCAIQGESPASGYGETGGHRVASATGRILRANV